MNKIKKMIPIIIAFIIGISTTVGAATVFNSKDITYSSSSTSKTNVKDSLDELYSKLGKCPEGKYCYTEPIGLSDKVELGDYISMTPTSTSYTPSELTGCLNDANCTQNTINPSELNLWRVIKKNDNGTVDVVSEYVSSNFVVFYGKTGYLNFVGVLNRIAAQYTNLKYVQSTRYMGYSNQIEFCSSLDDCPGELSHIKDYNLVKEAIGTVEANNLEGEDSMYWIASRYNDGNGYQARGFFGDRSEYGKHELYNKENNIEIVWAHSVRPILTLKSNVLIESGDGKSASTAYKFE